jgi:ATP-binding cassette, subfamily C, bacterial
MPRHLPGGLAELIRGRRVFMQDSNQPAAQGADPGAIRFIRDFLDHMGSRRLPAAVLLILGALLEGVGLLLLLPLLGIVLGTGAGHPWLDAATGRIAAFAPDGSLFWQLVALLTLFGLLLAVRAFVILAREVLLARLQAEFVESHRYAVVRLLAGARWEMVSRLRHGRITHVLGQDIQAIGDAAQLVLRTAVAATMLGGQFVLVFILSPTLALIILALAIPKVLALRPALGRSRQLGANLTDANLTLVTGTTQFLGGLKLAISQDLERAFVRNFKTTLARAADQRVAFARQRAATQLTLTTAAALLGGLVILIGVGVVGVGPAALIAFLVVLARMIGPATQIQAGAQQLFHSLPAYGKIKKLEAELNAAQRDFAAADGAPMPAIDGTIEFVGAGYRHKPDGGDGSGVADLSLRIVKGDFVGVTGPSGAGKTTFADLLTGLCPPQLGEVLLDGRPLTGPVLNAWRNRISYVSQDPFLFHDTVRANLLWARPDAAEDELWAALDEAGAAQLVRGMEAGLDTIVGERGGLVSGGERQRIALARALLRRPCLLLLDEATNAIDAAGEQETVGRLAARPDRPTIVMIAHRRESLDLCERLLELRAGRIVADSRKASR